MNQRRAWLSACSVAVDLETGVDEVLDRAEVLDGHVDDAEPSQARQTCQWRKVGHMCRILGVGLGCHT